MITTKSQIKRTWTTIHSLSFKRLELSFSSSLSPEPFGLRAPIDVPAAARESTRNQKRCGSKWIGCSRIAVRKLSSWSNCLLFRIRGSMNALLIIIVILIAQTRARTFETVSSKRLGTKPNKSRDDLVLVLAKLAASVVFCFLINISLFALNSVSSIRLARCSSIHHIALQHGSRTVRKLRKSSKPTRFCFHFLLKLLTRLRLHYSSRSGCWRLSCSAANVEDLYGTRRSGWLWFSFSKGSLVEICCKAKHQSQRNKWNGIAKSITALHVSLGPCSDQ